MIAKFAKFSQYRKYIKLLSVNSGTDSEAVGKILHSLNRMGIAKCKHCFAITTGENIYSNLIQDDEKMTLLVSCDCSTCGQKWVNNYNLSEDGLTFVKEDLKMENSNTIGLSTEIPIVEIAPIKEVEIVPKLEESKVDKYFNKEKKSKSKPVDTDNINERFESIYSKDPFSNESLIMHYSRTGESIVFDRFIKAFQEAVLAGSQGLDEAGGMLLRKACEYLIIDYLKFGAGVKHQDYILHAGQKIYLSGLAGYGLSKCIDLIEDLSLKELCKRAVWIGNDNVHTKKRWSKFDSKDLERLIMAMVLNIYSKLECLHYLTKMR